jgi:lipoprotein-releasing system permease protein
LRKYKNISALSFASFIAARITFKSKRTFSKLIVRIAIIGIMLGLGVMILSVAIVKGFKQEVRDKIRGFSGDLQIIKYDLNNSSENSPVIVSDSLVKALGKIPLVTHVMPFATKPGIIRANDDLEGVVLKGVDKTYDWTFFKKSLEAGNVISFKDSLEAKTQIMISRYTADRLRLKVGDNFLMYFVQEPLRKRKFRICGIYDTGVDEVDKNFVIGDLSVVQRLNDWRTDQIGGYELGAVDFDAIGLASSRVNDVLPPYLRSYTVSETYPTIFEWLKLLDVNTDVILVLMLMVALINMISALLIMILERTTMIGMLKALGATNWTIQKVFLYNAMWLIGLGMLCGNAFALVIGIFQDKTHFFKLDQASYYMKFVPIQLNWLDIVALNMGTLFVCTLVMLIPSMLITRISPVKAIRFK